VIVISHDAFNEQPGWRSVIVVPISTSGSQARRGPTAVLLPEGSGGLAHESVALCHQVTTLDRAKLTDFIGSLHSDRLAEVAEGLKIAQGLDLA
jgi:mRNA-degrading endonuclease toxin of MazEF toxin-antitoxin module